MKMLLTTRGAPGSGKSTWIREHGLEPYTLCADVIRTLIEGPVVDPESGKFEISQKNDNRVWKMLFELLEERMSRGELCVVDACHSKFQEFARYKNLVAQYGYRVYCIDFTDVPIETCMKQNLSRLEYKQVSREVLERIYSRFATQEPQSFVKMISHSDEEQVQKLLHSWEPKDLSSYERVVVFGDIHGCFDALQAHFKQHPLSESTFYLFTGDYIDRGIQNREVVQWLLENYEKPNVALLEGNHEKWLREFAEGRYEGCASFKCKSSEFATHTMPQLAEFDKKKLRQLCRKLWTVAKFKFDGQEFLVTHAGVGAVPDSVPLISAKTFIRGGKYEDPIDEWYEQKWKEGMPIQIHGHRNIEHIEAGKFPHSINLCSEVEFGEPLRVVILAH